MRNFLSTVASNMAAKKKLVSVVAVVVVAVAFAIVQKPAEDDFEEVQVNYGTDTDTDV